MWAGANKADGHAHLCEMEVRQAGKSAVITMKSGENRIDAEFIESFHRALDAVEK